MIYNIKLSEFDNYMDSIKNTNAIVYIKNYAYGFCSTLICFINNLEYLQEHNLNIYPLWNKNTEYFKYSENNNDCFNLLFEDNKIDLIDESRDIYYVESDTHIYQSKKYTSPCDNMLIVKNIFNNRFKIKNYLYDKYNKLLNNRKVTFSIHLRSNYQKQIHYPERRLNVEDICHKLSLIYDKNSTPFIATDTLPYLQIFLKYFPNSIYNDCERVDDDSKDSVPNLNNSGIIHGENVLIDLIGLSSSENTYMSYSNFMVIVKYLISDDIKINDINEL